MDEKFKTRNWDNCFCMETYLYSVLRGVTQSRNGSRECLVNDELSKMHQKLCTSLSFILFFI